MADRLTNVLKSAGIRVVRYDPSQLWEDPVERMATAIAEEVGCLVCLQLGQPLSRWVQEEVQWARKCELPVIFVDDQNAFAQVPHQVIAQPATGLPWATAHDRFESTVNQWDGAEEELQRSTTVLSDLNWIAKSDETPTHAAIMLLLLLASVGCLLVIVLAVIMSFFFSAYVLFIALACLVGFVCIVVTLRLIWQSFAKSSDLQRKRRT